MLFSQTTRVKVILCMALLFIGGGVEAKKKGKVATAQAEVVVPAATLALIKLNGSDGKDIVKVASDSKDHSTLVTAVVAADLVTTLSGQGPYTLFAPTNEAFAKLPKGTVEDLLKPENKLKLKSILEHHAAVPAYSPTILAGLTEMDMVDGPKLKVTSKGGKFFVDGVEIKAALAAQNGIVYIVDTILLNK